MPRSVTVPGGGGGGLVTVMAALPLCPSLVAVMVAEPAVTPVTNPLPFTVAMDPLPLAQTIVRPVNTLPDPSLVVAVSCAVWPACTLADAGLTVTVATGTLETEMTAVPVRPSLVAVIVAEPTATAPASPLPFTAATDGLLLVQVTVRPLSTLPAESVVVAPSWMVCPTNRLAADGFTVTAATGTAVTVTTDVSVVVPGCPWATTFTVPVSV